ncbi:polyprenol monophosphomannose synthase [Corynebacterium sp. HMSC11E11]|uniref:polyprenol monophosphomannose synthase n=1 Tax=Corynebacterium sp. HMSC11E11 TaxID=1581089 RepID=UPI0008A1CCD4|nr:polyprenol monophosphomannose synthase [Corynebacterium sp. HMSC11E11]OFU53636.1 polyprenol monophosphomannose synthase [Corynebacterium sp. HMSC11E11]
MSKPSDSTLVIIPTFNERENLPLIVGRLRSAQPDVHVLVVDDSSPDGTGDVADELAAEAPEHIHVLHREGKGGLWGAYRAGFAWGLERDYQVLCEMDADGSHAPEQLHLLLDEIDAGADLVIGSRYVPGGSTVNWPASRKILSRGGNLYISLLLGAGISDITAGYRAFRREVLETLDFDSIGKEAYLFQTEIGWKTVRAGFDVREVPITFTERVYGESKLSGSFVTDSLTAVTSWGLGYRAGQVRDIAGEIGRLARHSIKKRF